MPPRTVVFLSLLVALARPAAADGLADNLPDKVRPIPQRGIEVSAADREALESALSDLGAAIDRLAGRKDAKVDALLPDVRIDFKAVRDALTYDEFFSVGEIAIAKNLLKQGRTRADQLERGEADWPSQTGLVVRGYVSKIDGSVQPYGLVVPESYTTKGPGRFRLDLWFHGRNEDLSEVNFLDRKQKDRGEFIPADTIVLHPYGRYCNAFKFAGEVDVYEALDDVRRRYRVDDERTFVRGFSMGGAATWHFAVHDASRWCGANPGAGFSETPEFLKFFQKETLHPSWYEEKLWNLYDCPGYALNLKQCPTVAYSGETDIQKQAADVMAAAMDKVGIDLLHIVGPNTAHKYHPDSAREVEARLASIAERGRDKVPATISLTTPTLKYNRMGWVAIDALGEHWKPAKVHATLGDDPYLEITTENVTALTVEIPAGWCDLNAGEIARIDDDRVVLPRPSSDRSLFRHFHKEGEDWKPGPAPADGLLKRHNLQGPIDDAFMDSFVFVTPTGESQHPKVRAWVDAERTRAVARWRRQFRGDARVKDDTDVNDADLASSNLVLWGDADDNAVLKRIADKLPIGWKGDRLVVGDRDFPAEDHAPLLIYPNPLNPSRYVVLNSGFTYREYDDLNNARQVPKLPDWAIVDVRTPPNSCLPGKLVAADFFSESWELRSARD